FQPLTWAPVTAKLGSGDGGAAGQMSVTLPSTEPFARPLSVMLPFDHTSPLTVVVDEPVKVIELPPLPPQPAGLRVWIAAPLVPWLRATAEAVAAIAIELPAPATCMMVTGMRWLAVAVKLTPATAWLTTLMVS